VQKLIWWKKLPIKKKRKRSEELDMELPVGWRTEITTRTHGKTQGRKDKYWYSPDGQKFRSIKAVREYLGLEDTLTDKNLNENGNTKTKNNYK